MFEYIDIEDVSNVYKVSPNTIRNWIKKGFPALKIGSILRFNLESTENWINRNNKYKQEGE